jgi:hypothetical protein
MEKTNRQEKIKKVIENRQDGIIRQELKIPKE